MRPLLEPTYRYPPGPNAMPHRALPRGEHGGGGRHAPAGDQVDDDPGDVAVGGAGEHRSVVGHRDAVDARQAPGAVARVGRDAGEPDAYQDAVADVGDVQQLPVVVDTHGPQIGVVALRLVPGRLDRLAPAQAADVRAVARLPGEVDRPGVVDGDALGGGDARHVRGWCCRRARVASRSSGRRWAGSRPCRASSRPCPRRRSRRWRKCRRSPVAPPVAVGTAGGRRAARARGSRRSPSLRIQRRRNRQRRRSSRRCWCRRFPPIPRRRCPRSRRCRCRPSPPVLAPPDAAGVRAARAAGAGGVAGTSATRAGAPAVPVPVPLPPPPSPRAMNSRFGEVQPPSSATHRA